MDFRSFDVAAVLPVRDRAALLAEAMQSILAGKTRPRELIVVVNSKGPAREADLGAARAAADQAGDVIVRILTEERPGPAAARNRGWRAAAASWISFLDSDDLWAPEKLAAQLRFLARRPHLDACHTGERWLKHGRELSQPRRLAPRSGAFLYDAFETCLISCSSILLRRSLLETLGGFDETFPVCEDFELWLRLLARTPVGLVPEPLTIKRSGDWAQLSQSRHSMDAWRIRAILKFAAATPLDGRALAAARNSVERKLRILQQGADKRRTTEPVERLAGEVRQLWPDLISPARP